MKKLMAWFMAAAMVLSMAGCGASSSSASDTPESGETGGKSMSMIWWGNQVRNEGTQAALELYEEQNPGVTVDAQFAEWGDYWNKLATASAAHTLPDVIQMDYKYLSQYVDNKLLVDLNQFVDAGVLDVSNVDKGILQAGSKDGGLYALCIGVNAPALMYNKTLLDENNIQIKDNMTMDEFIAVCKEVYEKTGVKTDLGYGSGDIWEYMVRSTGKNLYEGNKFGVDSAEEFVPYFKLYENGIAEGWMISPEIFAERALGSIEQAPIVFGTTPEQRSWCSTSYSNQLAAFEAAAQAENIEIALTTWPSPDPKKSNYLKPGQFFSVTVDSKYPEDAAKIIDFWTNSVECNEILNAERGIPASSKTAEALNPKLDATQQKITDYVNNVVTPNCSAISPAAPENSAEVLKLHNMLQEQVCYGRMTAEEAAEQLFTEGNSILAG